MKEEKYTNPVKNERDRYEKKESKIRNEKEKRVSQAKIDIRDNKQKTLDIPVEECYTNHTIFSESSHKILKHGGIKG